MCLDKDNHMLTFFNNSKYIGLLIIFQIFFSWQKMALGIMPEEILVIANKNVNGSVDIAQYYMRKRGIPESHLLPLALSLNETISRQDYEKELSESTRHALKTLPSNKCITAIVLVYGVPLKVAAPLPGEEDIELTMKYRQYRDEIIGNLDMSFEDVEQEQKELNKKINLLRRTNQKASVDSELSLVKVNKYNLANQIPNPYFIGFQGENLDIHKDQVLLVSRLDGPDKETVYRIIDDTLEIEKKGLKGKAYFDARWPFPVIQDDLSGYRLYDASLHKAGKAMMKRMQVIVDDREELFQVNACPNAAIYCGWYSLARYIDSFDWQKGAIGYHIASNECSTLREKGSSVWCLKMLEKGVAATIGPVYEPYVQGFPLPEVFFSYLVDGYLSLGEAYMISLPYLSWQMVLVGDPLYQPFKPMKL